MRENSAHYYYGAKIYKIFQFNLVAFFVERFHTLLKELEGPLMELIVEISG